MKKVSLILVIFLLGPSLSGRAADYNGDGRDDIAVFRPSTGLWAIRGVTRAYFGGDGDNPAPGDYNGDGTDEIAVSRPATGLWAVKGVTRTYFGASSDVTLGGSGGRWLPSGNNIYYSGNSVGIGTTDLNYKLEVGDVGDSINYLRLGSSSFGGILFYDGYSSDSGGIIYHHGSDALVFETKPASGAPTEKMRITSDGKVGIGTDGPNFPLHIHKDSSSHCYLQFTNTATGSGGSDGVLVGLDPNEDFRIHSYESKNIEFYINNDQKAVITSAGDVGIGTSSPAYRLTVTDTVGDNVVASVINSSSDADADGLAIKINASTPGNGNFFLSCHKANGALIGGIKGNGAGGIAWSGDGSDFAEYLPRLRVEEEIGAGEVVGVFGGRISRATRGADQLLVISTAPIVLGNTPPAGEELLYEPVAFLGRVPVKVRGPVRAGDYIISSGLDDGTGVAVPPGEMTLASAARVVGRAWEDSSQSGVRLVEAAVGMRAANRALLEQVERLQARLDKLEAE